MLGDKLLGKKGIAGIMVSTMVLTMMPDGFVEAGELIKQTTAKTDVYAEAVKVDFFDYNFTKSEDGKVAKNKILLNDYAIEKYSEMGISEKNIFGQSQCSTGLKTVATLRVFYYSV